jgi:hypothetical protein
MTPTEQKLLKIQEKIFQVLRIKNNWSQGENL